MTTTDLSPRPVPPRRRRGMVPVLVVIAVLLAIGLLLVKTLGDASLFFKNVDEAIEQRDDLGAKRFRMQGTVVPGTIVEGEISGRGAVFFTVSFNGRLADVASFDNPTELFKDGIPVVLEGHWTAEPLPSGERAGRASDGWHFASDRILVKHDADYTSQNEARLTEAELGGKLTGATGSAP
jgi:cytochrome c-type biogenesis protein CcmE